LAAAQPVPILIHSNLDDGFAAQFHDAACALGAALIEGYIVDELMDGHVAHCYGHTYSEPLTRLAFQRALARVSKAPGTMIYGNTTVFTPELVENYARLAGYLLVDIVAQRSRPSGHAIHPVPVTEAMRIPDVDEIIDAHLFCHRLIERASTLEPLVNPDAADELSHRIERGGGEFKRSVLAGLAEAEIDIKNPFEMFLALRRIGAKQLEQRFGPGERPSVPSERRKPLVKATTVAEIEEKAARCLDEIDEDRAKALRAARLTACIATTDVHEYGKVLVEAILRALGVGIVDAGVSTDPDVLAEAAREGDADFIALSTYNGVALDYLQRLRREMDQRDLDIPTFIGGKLNQIMDDSSGSLPIDVSRELESAGAIVCRRVEEMIERLFAIAEKRNIA
jgi:methylmalonyl-CoA mutase cobalamin-binding subunit